MTEQNARQQFTELFETYADQIFRHMLFKVSNRERAKELTQEVFTRVWQTMCKGEAIRYPKAFLYTIAHNLYVNEWRDRKDTVSLELLPEDATGHFQEDLECNLLRHEASAVIALFAKLPPRYAEVLTLRYVDEWEVRDIAELLGESPNAVSVRIHRALAALRGLLQQ